jgi:hypothetical protein
MDDVNALRVVWATAWLESQERFDLIEPDQAQILREILEGDYALADVATN